MKREKEKLTEKELNDHTIKTMQTSITNTYNNDFNDNEDSRNKLITRFANSSFKDDVDIEKYNLDEDYMYSQLSDQLKKEIHNYHYSNVEAKLKQIYFFPMFIKTSNKPECFATRFDKSDKYIAGGYSTGHIVVFDTQSGNYVKHMSLSDYPVSSIRWKQANGKAILNAVHSDGKVSQWFANAGKMLYSFEEKDNFIMCLDYDIQGSTFATGGSDDKLRLYDDTTKTLISTIGNNFDQITHTNRIFSLCFGKDNSYEKLIVSGGWDNTIKFSDIRTKKVVNSIYGPHIVGDTIDLKHHYLLTGSTDIKDQIKIWDLRTYQAVETVKFEPDQNSEKNFVTNINCAQFSKLSYLYDDKSGYINTFACGGQKRNQVRVFSNHNDNLDLESVANTYYNNDSVNVVDNENNKNLEEKKNTITPSVLTKSSRKSLKSEISAEKKYFINQKLGLIENPDKILRLPLTKIENISECIYSLDYMHHSNNVAYGSGLGCIYSLDLNKKKHDI